MPFLKTKPSHPTPLPLEEPPNPLPQPSQRQPSQRRWYHFTWHSLLLLTGMVGLGGVLVVPAFNCGGSKAIQAEGRTTVQMLNRAQAAYRQEHPGFGKTLSALEVGIQPKTTNYEFALQTTPQAAYSYALVRSTTTHTDLRSYVGAVFVLPSSRPAVPVQTVSISCEAIQTGSTFIVRPVLQKGSPTCAPGTREWNRK